MSFAPSLRRALLVALASLALSSPAALARPADAAPKSSTDANVLEHTFDPFPVPQWPIEPALAQERYYASYGEPTAPPKGATDAGDGVAPVPFVLAVAGALMVGLGAGSGLHLIRSRHRHATGLAT